MGQFRGQHRSRCLTDPCKKCRISNGKVGGEGNTYWPGFEHIDIEVTRTDIDMLKIVDVETG